MRNVRKNMGAVPLLLLLAACGGASMTGTNNSGISATALLSVSPAPSATNVPTTGPFVMVFNGAMHSGMEQYVDMHKGDVSGAVMPMTCAWSADQKTLTCNVNAPLASQTTYVLHMGAGMTGSSGGVINMTAGRMMGGIDVTSGMMNFSHGGQSTSMMGSGWLGTGGWYGMTFSFRTM